MKTVDIDKPFRPTLGFWITYAILAIPAFWISRPWFWDLPIYSRVAGVILCPFLAAVFVYCSFEMIGAVVVGGPNQRKAFWAFLVSVACAALVLGIECIRGGFDHVPPMAPAFVVFLAVLVYHRLNKKVQNQHPDSASPSVTPPAGREGKP
ncbi:MAG: hypothetical protein WAK51_04270 [Opitutaceae bacterium]